MKDKFLLLAWCLLIFLGSSLPGAEISPNELVDFIAHKLIHVVEYGVLAILAYRALAGVKHRAWYTLVFSVLYALGDEYHQRFVPGRNGRVRDVVVDAVGSVMGVILFPKFLTLTTLYRSSKRKAQMSKP